MFIGQRFIELFGFQQMYHRGAVIEKNAPSRPLACALLGKYDNKLQTSLGKLKWLQVIWDNFSDITHAQQRRQRKRHKTKLGPG